MCTKCCVGLSCWVCCREKDRVLAFVKSVWCWTQTPNYSHAFLRGRRDRVLQGSFTGTPTQPTVYLKPPNLNTTKLAVPGVLILGFLSLLELPEAQGPGGFTTCLRRSGPFSLQGKESKGSPLVYRLALVKCFFFFFFKKIVVYILFQCLDRQLSGLITQNSYWPPA